MKTHVRVASLLVILILTSCCSLWGKNEVLYDSIPSALAEDWMHNDGLETTAVGLDDNWWKSIDDNLLDSLIVLGIQNNFNIAMAARRINIAANTVRMAAAAYYPTLGLNASWTRQRTSGNTTSESLPASIGSYWNLGLNLSWEIDLFGKISSKVSQERELLKVSRAEYNGAILALTANIANTYVQLRVWQAEREVAIEHTNRQQRVVKITEDRMECGLGNKLEIAQAREVYYSTVASISMLESSINTAINSLAILVGLYPEQIYQTLIKPRPLPDYHILVPVGIPANLVSRRPDIVAARQQLESYAKALGVARKDFLPTLTIEGSIGTMAHDAKNLMDKPSFTYSISPTLSWTLFNGLQRKYNVNIAKEQIQIGIDNYNYTVMTAVQDVENAMSSYKSSMTYIGWLEKLVAESDTALDLSLDLYKSSLTQFSNVVDAQMSVLENRNTLIVAHGKALSEIINLYEAIGGAI